VSKLETKEIFKMIRHDLDVTQYDLACSKFKIGRTTISRIESGSRELNPRQAIIIANKMLEIQREKNIILDYEISADFLRGIQRFNTDAIVKAMKKEVNRKSLKELDTALGQMIGRDYVDLSIKAINILENDLYKNSNLLVMYISEVLKHNVTFEENIDMHLILTRAYYAQGNFKGILHLSETFLHEIIQCSDIEKKIKFYYNVATANFIEKNHEEALRLVDIMKKMKTKIIEGKILNLEANIALDLKEYESAKKINFKVIKVIKDITIEANAYSNIAWIYYVQKKYKQAKRYIDKACEFINEVSVQCSFNILDNKFDICIALNLEEEVKKTFEELLLLFQQFHNETQQNKIFENMFNYLKYSKNDSLAIIDRIKCNNLKISANLKIKLIEKFRNDIVMINHIL
jgi:tetratricopeptide (TPR) repeat protein